MTTAQDIEISVAHWFGISNHLIVPNVSYSMFPFEIDLAVMTSSRYLYEVEIKISKSDLIRDKQKHKWNIYDLYGIKFIWFAIPNELQADLQHVPDRAGVLLYEPPMKNQAIGTVKQIRKPVKNALTKKFSEKDELKLCRLCAFRMWDMKMTNAVRRLQKLPLDTPPAI